MTAPESARASFEFEVATGLPPSAALERIVDVRRHGRLVPFTTGTGPQPGALRADDVLVARTALGRWGFDDVMNVEEFRPGSRVRLRKVGRVLGGQIDVRVERTEGEVDVGTRVRWQQQVVFPFLPRVLGEGAARVVAPVLGRGYRVVVRRLLADPA